eukprot:TRINITY_DN16521_c0_g3_i1.p1 TRINITY_DN16521_c0_g3~~TRINITY_DN16521_c0_g3_i1.p1  ORF type:complete len:960 (-),score=181.57 TRINITY_DN16521_c0_g3_i1:270-3149(-)
MAHVSRSRASPVPDRSVTYAGSAVRQAPTAVVYHNAGSLEGRGPLLVPGSPKPVAFRTPIPVRPSGGVVEVTQSPPRTRELPPDRVLPQPQIPQRQFSVVHAQPLAQQTLGTAGAAACSHPSLPGTPVQPVPRMLRASASMSLVAGPSGFVVQRTSTPVREVSPARTLRAPTVAAPLTTQQQPERARSECCRTAALLPSANVADPAPPALEGVFAADMASASVFTPPVGASVAGSRKSTSVASSSTALPTSPSLSLRSSIDGFGSLKAPPSLQAETPKAATGSDSTPTAGAPRWSWSAASPSSPSSSNRLCATGARDLWAAVEAVEVAALSLEAQQQGGVQAAIQAALLEGAPSPGGELDEKGTASDVGKCALALVRIANRLAQVSGTAQEPADMAQSGQLALTLQPAEPSHSAEESREASKESLTAAPPSTPAEEVDDEPVSEDGEPLLIAAVEKEVARLTDALDDSPSTRLRKLSDLVNNQEEPLIRYLKEVRSLARQCSDKELGTAVDSNLLSSSAASCLQTVKALRQRHLRTAASHSGPVGVWRSSLEALEETQQDSASSCGPSRSPSPTSHLSNPPMCRSAPQTPLQGTRSLSASHLHQSAGHGTTAASSGSQVSEARREAAMKRWASVQELRSPQPKRASRRSGEARRPPGRDVSEEQRSQRSGKGYAESVPHGAAAAVVTIGRRRPASTEPPSERGQEEGAVVESAALLGRGAYRSAMGTMPPAPGNRRGAWPRRPAKLPMSARDAENINLRQCEQEARCASAHGSPGLRPRGILEEDEQGKGREVIDLADEEAAPKWGGASSFTCDAPRRGAQRGGKQGTGATGPTRKPSPPKTRDKTPQQTREKQQQQQLLQHQQPTRASAARETAGLKREARPKLASQAPVATKDANATGTATGNQSSDSRSVRTGAAAGSSRTGTGGTGSPKMQARQLRRTRWCAGDVVGYFLWNDTA